MRHLWRHFYKYVMNYMYNNATNLSVHAILAMLYRSLFIYNPRKHTKTMYHMTRITLEQKISKYLGGEQPVQLSIHIKRLPTQEYKEKKWRPWHDSHLQLVRPIIIALHFKTCMTLQQIISLHTNLLLHLFILLTNKKVRATKIEVTAWISPEKRKRQKHSKKAARIKGNNTKQGGAAGFICISSASWHQGA